MLFWSKKQNTFFANILMTPVATTCYFKSFFIRRALILSRHKSQNIKRILKVTTKHILPNNKKWWHKTIMTQHNAFRIACCATGIWKYQYIVKYIHFYIVWVIGTIINWNQWFKGAKTNIISKHNYFLKKVQLKHSTVFISQVRPLLLSLLVYRKFNYYLHKKGSENL